MKAILIAPSNNFFLNPLIAEPLGLMYIEAVLKQMGIEVEVIDTSFESKIPEGDLYCFSAATIHYPQILELSKNINGYKVIGGPHASALPMEVKKHFDAVVVGPGTSAIIDVIKDFNANKRGGVFRSPVSDINSIPLAPRSILYKHKYTPFPNAPISASLITSMGCPYKCSFCASNTIWGRKVFNYSVDKVITEIKYLKSTFGINHFKFVDDTLTLNKRRFKEISNALIPLDVKWICNTRIDAIDDEILDQMINSGCDYVDLGVESVDDDVLDKINKHQKIEDVERAIEKIKSKNLKVKVYLIYGLPFEPEDIVQKTIDFIEKNEPDHVSLFTLVPYPGTDICDNYEKYNIKKIYDDFNVYQHSVGGKKSELEWLPSIEYNDRSREFMRDERNTLKLYADNWNNRR